MTERVNSSASTTISVVDAEYIQSVYVDGMLKKKQDEINKVAIRELLSLENELEKKMVLQTCMKERLNKIHDLMTKLTSLEVRNVSLSEESLSATEKSIEEMKELMDNLEKTCDQLPMKSLKPISNNEKEYISSLLEDINSLLTVDIDDAKKNDLALSIVVNKMQYFLNSDLNAKKDDCDALMKRISDLHIEKIAKIGSEVASKFVSLM